MVIEGGEALNEPGSFWTAFTHSVLTFTKSLEMAYTLRSLFSFTVEKFKMESTITGSPSCHYSVSQLFGKMSCYSQLLFYSQLSFKFSNVEKSSYIHFTVHCFESKDMQCRKSCLEVVPFIFKEICIWLQTASRLLMALYSPYGRLWMSQLYSNSDWIYNVEKNSMCNV